MDFYEEYQRNTNDISIYYEHILAERVFGDRFYFDVGFILDKIIIQNNKERNDDLNFLDWKIQSGFKLQESSFFYPNDRKKIELQQNSQGYKLLDCPYKVIWSVKNPRYVYFSDIPVIFTMNQARAIGSCNKKEILYLHSLLNNNVNIMVLHNFLKSSNEKDYLLAIKSIKEFVRIPKITEDNQFIKKEIIKSTEQMLKLEETKLSDFIDFSKVMLQKFDKVAAKDNNLVLEKNSEKIKLSIKESKNLVKKVIIEKYSKPTLKLEEQKISLQELKNLPVIDYDEQQKIKDYIDDLVFALYFRIDLGRLGLSNAKKIKKKCYKNPYYKFVNNQKL